MKRKYLSALLMGTLTVASVSTFTSCKDYDDDISSLQEKIDKLATADQLASKVSELQALISANSSDINSLKSELAKKTTLDEVKTLLADYATKKYVDDADATLDAAIKALQTKDIAELKTKIEELQTKAEKDLKDAKEELNKAIKDAQDAADVAGGKADDNADAIKALDATVKKAAHADSLAAANKTDIENALKMLGTGYSEQNTISAAIKAINGQLESKTSGLAALASRLSSVETILKGADEDSKLGLSDKVNSIETSLKDIIGQFSTMVTDVQLYDFVKYPNALNHEKYIDGFNRTLNFAQAVEKNNVFPATAGIADKQLTFEDGKYYVGEDSLLIRVSPVDAELTASNVSLMNSQGKELNDLIDVTDVHRYNKLLLGSTRAANSNTGLWVVKFKAKELGDAFKEAAVSENRAILYSVAVKNNYTTDKENTRRVTSEYGVELNNDPAEYAWDFKVNDQSVAYIHNRYVQTETFEWTDDASGYYKKNYAPELTWIDNSKPATSAILEGANKNAEDRHGHTTGSWGNGVDNRQSWSILAVEKGKPITIDFSNTDLKGVKGFYVTLDEKFAQESAPSELNAWNSYSYENVGYKNTPAKLFEGSKGTITIKDMGNVQGDVIGFRVYAVNYDGTLTDPDGRSFYVAVGDVKQDKALGDSKLTLNANNKFESTIALDADFTNFDFTNFTGWQITEDDASGNKPSWKWDGTGDFTVKYYNADGEEVQTLDNTVKSIKFILNNPLAFIDGATYNVSTTLTKNISSATSNVCDVTASFTKVMPTEAPTFDYRDGFTSTQYIIPNGRSYEVASTNKGGTFDLRNTLIINNNTTWKGQDLFDENNVGIFQFNVAEGTYDADKKLATANATGTSYIMTVSNNGDKNLVDNTTKRSIAAIYNYKNISKRLDDKGENYIYGDYPVPSKSSKEIIYCSWMKTFEYDVTSNIKNKVEQNTWLNNNTVQWNATASAAQPLKWSALAASVKDLGLLPVTKGVNGKTMKEFIDAKVITIVDNNVYTTSNDGKQKNPYFSASITDEGISLEQISQASIPSSVTGGKIHFTIKDCFGNTKAIELPFKIKVNQVPATARKH